MEFPEVVGALANMTGKVKAGLVRAGIKPEAISVAMAQFCANSALEDGAFQYGLNLVSPVVGMSAIIDWPEAGMRIDMRNGYVFTVDEVFDLEVDGFIPADEIVTRGGHVLADWPWLGKKFWVAGKRTVKAVLGRLNRTWTEEIVFGLLKKPGCRFKGSGAWVREAFLAARPSYDSRGWIGFAGDSASVWQENVVGSSRLVSFPDLRGREGEWHRGFTSLTEECFSSDRLCLLWE